MESKYPKVNKLIQIITKNLGIKIFCLLSAVLLWVYVASGQSSVGKFPGSIKIKAINVPAGLVAIYDEDTVEIKIMADSSTWRKLSSDSFSAYVDLSSYSEGTYELPVNVVSSVPDVQIVEKTPEKIFVSLEPIVKKEVGINKKIEGSAAEGLVAGNIEINPSIVEAKGPKSLIENLTEATIVINLNGESEDFSKKVDVVALNSRGEIIDEIEFFPTEVEVNVSIVKASNNKTVGVKVNINGSPDSGYYVSDITAIPSVVDITGPTALLSEVNYIETTDLNIDGVQSNLDRTLSLKIPDGIALQSGISEKVRVLVKVGKVESNRELTVSLEPQNLGDYSVVSYSPSVIKVTCSGPIDAINSLKEGDVKLLLDFQDKNMSNAVSFSVNKNDFSTPDNITITNISSTNITVNLKKN